MQKTNKKRKRALLLMAAYVVAVSISIVSAVCYFMDNSSTRGLLAFERFSEQITYRVSDHLSKYTEQLILLKSELADREINDLAEIQSTMQRYIDNSLMEGIGFVTEDGAAQSYSGAVEVFDEPIDVLDVLHNYPYAVTLSQNSIGDEDKLLFRILWEGEDTSKAVALYGYLPLSVISDLLKDTTYGNAGAFVAIVDHNGDHLWNSSDTLENKEGHNLIRDLEVYDLNDGATRLELQLSGVVTYTAYGDERVLFYEPLGYNYWTLLTITPRDSVLNTESEIQIIIVLLVGILSIVAVAFWFFHKNQKAELALVVAQKESIFKGKFLSNVSHEIRTPLNGISGTLHLLKNCAYIDTNNCPFADTFWKLGIAQPTGFTKESGFCSYPLWSFDEDFLKQIGGEEYEQYSKAFDDYMGERYEEEEPEMEEENESFPFDNPMQ